jgi:hypothetical protein
MTIEMPVEQHVARPCLHSPGEACLDDGSGENNRRITLQVSMAWSIGMARQALDSRRDAAKLMRLRHSAAYDDKRDTSMRITLARG